MTLVSPRPSPLTSRLQPSPPVTHGWSVIARDLTEVEVLLHAEAASEVPLAQAVCGAVHAAGGKRLRPALVLLACRALESSAPDARVTGAAVEMIHAATLLHDDVVDRSSSRRGRVTAFARWGSAPAVLGGDLLFSRAFGLLARHGQGEELRVLSTCMLTMCRGEIMQNVHRGDLEMTEGAYYDVIRAKTADFISACCRVGAMRADASSVTIERLAEYGMNLGLAFQVTDDLLDLCGDETEIGKPLGGDLREGKMTLPVILALRAARPAERERVKQIAGKPVISRDEFEEVRTILYAYDAPARACLVAEDLACAAIRALDPLPDTPARDALVALACGLSSRSK